MVSMLAPTAAADQYVSNGLKRIFAPGNANLDIDGRDDLRVDVDVAVLDSGIDLDHPDLNVIDGINCLDAVAPTYQCVSSSPTDGDDSHGHGTAAAGTIGAIDNGIGIVGVAPGARLWAVDVLGDDAFTSDPHPIDRLVAGVRWVTATRTDSDPTNDIEVAIILACSPLAEPAGRAASCPSDDEGDAYEDAVEESIDQGVVVVAPGGNATSTIDKVVPARDPLLIGVSAMSDFDGAPGGLIDTPTCQGIQYPEQTQQDDTLSANTNNQGSGVDIAAPGYCIAFTTPGGGQWRGSPGSSVSAAFPHVAGAAALLASAAQPDSRADVEAIRNDLLAAGNQDWTDDSGDGTQEPLLDVGDEEVFEPVTAPGNGSSDAIGMFGVNDGTWRLRTTTTAGSPNYSFPFYWGSQADVPLAGDWNGDGVDTIGMFRPGNGTWNLRNTSSGGPAEITFAYYWGADWDVPVTGDWDGDGDDTIGMYRPGDGTWHLRNSNSSGTTDVAFYYSAMTLSDVPVVGDWDGDGDDTVGMFRPSTGMWHLRNTNAPGSPDISFSFYWGASWDVPVTGDWDGDGADTIGMYRPGDGTWHLRNSNSSGAAQLEFSYPGNATWDVPVVGDWDG